LSSKEFLRPAAFDVGKHGPDLLVRKYVHEMGHVALYALDTESVSTVLGNAK
jgi:hypothetical protein